MWSSWKLSLKLGPCRGPVGVMCRQLVNFRKKIDLFYEENYFIKCCWNYPRCLCDGCESESSIEHFAASAAKAAARPCVVVVSSLPACVSLPSVLWALGPQCIKACYWVFSSLVQDCISRNSFMTVAKSHVCTVLLIFLIHVSYCRRPSLLTKSQPDSVCRFLSWLRNMQCLPPHKERGS